jgi:hypothetical protein
MQVKQPKPPADAGRAAKALWRQIVADAIGQGVELTAAELVYLRQAGRLADTIELLEQALVGAELVVPGYLNKGSVINPVLSELRMHRQLLVQTVNRIDLEVPDAPGIPAGTGTSNRFRAAAMARWAGA